jgi:hypothetical protein
VPYLSYTTTNGITTLVLATNDVTYAGVKQVEMTVSLQNYPSITIGPITFNVEIMCEVLSMAFSTPPLSKSIEPGFDS